MMTDAEFAALTTELNDLTEAHAAATGVTADSLRGWDMAIEHAHAVMQNVEWLDKLTTACTAFASFNELELACLINGYVPTLRIGQRRQRILARVLLAKGHRVFPLTRK